MVENADAVRRIIIKTSCSNDLVQATVRDSGPGIADNAIEKMFAPFESTKKDGMGLGLAISRSLIESHSGELTIDGSYRNGAAFVVTIPAADSVASTRPTSQIARSYV